MFKLSTKISYFLQYDFDTFRLKKVKINDGILTDGSEIRISIKVSLHLAFSPFLFFGNLRREKAYGGGESEQLIHLANLFVFHIQKAYLNSM